jgi:hypothetical protein
MFGFPAERPALSWLLRHLGPPPPPRRHFSKSWDYVARHQAVPRPRKGASRPREACIHKSVISRYAGLRGC